jgi:hypothetical protein
MFIIKIVVLTALSSLLNGMFLVYEEGEKRRLSPQSQIGLYWYG